MAGQDSQETIPATPRSLAVAMDEVREIKEKQNKTSEQKQPLPTPARGSTAQPVEPTLMDTPVLGEADDNQDWNDEHWYTGRNWWYSSNSWQKWDGWNSKDWSGDASRFDDPAFLTPKRMNRLTSNDSIPSESGSLNRSSTTEQLDAIQAALAALPDGPQKEALAGAFRVNPVGFQSPPENNKAQVDPTTPAGVREITNTLANMCVASPPTLEASKQVPQQEGVTGSREQDPDAKHVEQQGIKAKQQQQNSTGSLAAGLEEGLLTPNQLHDDELMKEVEKQFETTLVSDEDFEKRIKEAQVHPDFQDFCKGTRIDHAIEEDEWTFGEEAPYEDLLMFGTYALAKERLRDRLALSKSPAPASTPVDPKTTGGKRKTDAAGLVEQTAQDSKIAKSAAPASVDTKNEVEEPKISEQNKERKNKETMEDLKGGEAMDVDADKKEADQEDEKKKTEEKERSQHEEKKQLQQAKEDVEVKEIPGDVKEDDSKKDENKNTANEQPHQGKNDAHEVKEIPGDEKKDDSKEDEIEKTELKKQPQQAKESLEAKLIPGDEKKADSKEDEKKKPENTQPHQGKNDAEVKEIPGDEKKDDSKEAERKKIEEKKQPQQAKELIVEDKKIPGDEKKDGSKEDEEKKAQGKEKAMEAEPSKSRKEVEREKKRLAAHATYMRYYRSLSSHDLRSI